MDSSSRLSHCGRCASTDQRPGHDGQAEQRPEEVRPGRSRQCLARDHRQESGGDDVTKAGEAVQRDQPAGVVAVHGRRERGRRAATCGRRRTRTTVAAPSRRHRRSRQTTAISTTPTMPIARSRPSLRAPAAQRRPPSSPVIGDAQARARCRSPPPASARSVSASRRRPQPEAKTKVQALTTPAAVRSAPQQRESVAAVVRGSGPVLHHQHLVRHGADHVDVVGDQQVAQALLALQPLQQPEHLLLDGDVERAGGLVEHQQLRLDDQRAGNGQPLALAAGELVRIAVCSRPGNCASVRPTSSAPQHALAPLLQRQAGSCTSRPSPTISSTVMRGDSEENGSWNTTCTSRRMAGWKRRPDPSACPPRPARPVRQIRPRAPAPGGLAGARLADDAQRAARRRCEVGALHGHELALAEPAANARQWARVAHAQRPPPASPARRRPASSWTTSRTGRLSISLRV
jgi:hypothetical protein